MKKLMLFVLLLSSGLMILSCTPKKITAPRKVISLADFALQGKIQSAHHRMLDSAWLSEVSMLREMDAQVRKQIDKSEPPQYQIMAMTCCRCGDGCCGPCDTTAMSASKSSLALLATNEVTSVSLKSSASEKPTVLSGEAVGDLKLFQLESSIPNGQYILEFEKAGYPPIKVPMTVEDKKILLKRDPGPK